MKTCFVCEKNPAKGKSGRCVGCKAEYNREWYKKNKKKHRASVDKNNQRYVESIRQLVRLEKERPCADCGRRYPYYVMDFDHVRGKKEGDVGRIASSSKSIEKVKKEIAKCEVVCSNCHRERTHKRSRSLTERPGPPKADASRFESCREHHEGEA